ncbi:LegC family aminotransferase [uncultured Helicobacter sp.]|uniref:LegC family aminotransferase n=1 Tax=uncultured Helicobacter sp. TaxID=175537 RepID=UPI00260E109C|nr:LegC family aminotransferase [uncultured Helicobacter sp.]
MSNQAFKDIFAFIRELYTMPEGFIPLHEPRFKGNEKQYLIECIESSFVSSVGAFVNAFEEQIAAFCGSKYAIATTNGTSALHASLYALGVNATCEVITQPLSFIATSNAIAYTGATPVYIDVDMESMSLSPIALQSFLQKYALKQQDGTTINKKSGKILKACVPMHTFGHPARIQEIKAICDEWNILLIEDAAESLGSYIIDNQHKIHTGVIGICGILSFNGNKTITCGGGGAILTQDEALAKRLKHLTTTAKIPHPYEYNHDELGFNYRLPNLNAALCVAQIEQLPAFLADKNNIAQAYKSFFSSIANIEFISARDSTQPNFWLNAIKLPSQKMRDELLEQSNAVGIMTRPIWKLNNECSAYRHCQSDDLTNAKALQASIVNLPSSVRIHAKP